MPTVKDLVEEVIENSRPLLFRGMRIAALNNVICCLGIDSRLSSPHYHEVERLKRIFNHFTKRQSAEICEAQLRLFAKHAIRYSLD